MSLKLYRQYRAALKTTVFDGKYMPYEWGQLPKRLSMAWMPYSMMFG